MEPLARAFTSLAQALVLPIQVVALVVAVLIVLCSLDDLVVDAWFWVREIYRARVMRKRYKPLPQAALFERPEQPIAIIVPAWQEQAVIAHMIETTVAAVSYADYWIYVGVYPNDPETQVELERARRRHQHVVRVELPHPGPTSKADCLNHVLAQIRADEVLTGRDFAGIVMHDPEDVIHPLELKFFNYLLPRIDLIQLPVVSLERRLRDLVAGAYMDEFAEWHAKDLVVRESFAGTVPSAGVGTCLSRRALLALTEGGRDAFNTRTLTEDYDLGIRLAQAGLKTIIARYPVEYRIKRRKFFGLGRQKTTTLRMPMCVREYFPDTFATSYRQKARWTIGIALQGWSQLGWAPSARVNYFLFRDRKALVVPIVVVFGYLVFLAFILLWLTLGASALTYPPEWRGFAAAIFGFNLAALINRIAHRMYFVNRIYGWEHALVSAPRMVMGSLVGFAATLRALRIFGMHLITREPIGWDKTNHVFPSDETLLRDRRLLGEILVRWDAVTERQLDWALGEQKFSEQRLGHILMSRGWVNEDTLAEAIATQSELPRAIASRNATLAHRALLPDRLWISLAAAPIGQTRDGAPILGVARPLSEAQRRQVAKVTGREPILRIICESEVASALRTLSGESAVLDSAPLLGDLLVDRGYLSRSRFDDVLAGYDPVRNGRLGAYLVDLGVIKREELTDAIAHQRGIAAGIEE